MTSAKAGGVEGGADRDDSSFLRLLLFEACQAAQGSSADGGTSRSDNDDNSNSGKEEGFEIVVRLLPPRRRPSKDDSGSKKKLKMTKMIDDKDCASSVTVALSPVCLAALLLRSIRLAAKSSLSKGGTLYPQWFDL